MHIRFSSAAADRSAALRPAVPSKALLAAAWVAAGVLSSCTAALVAAPAVLPMALSSFALLGMQVGLALVSAMAFGLATYMTRRALQRGGLVASEIPGPVLGGAAAPLAPVAGQQRPAQRIERGVQDPQMDAGAGPVGQLELNGADHRDEEADAQEARASAEPEVQARDEGQVEIADAGEAQGAAPLLGPGQPVVEADPADQPNPAAQADAAEQDDGAVQPHPVSQADPNAQDDPVAQDDPAIQGDPAIQDDPVVQNDGGDQNRPEQGAGQPQPAAERRVSWAQDAEAGDAAAHWRARREHRNSVNGLSRQARQARFLARRSASAQLAPAAAAGPALLDEPVDEGSGSAAGSGARLPVLSPLLNQPRTPSWQERQWMAQQRAAAVEIDGFSREQLLESGAVYQIDLHFAWLGQMQAALQATQPLAGSPESNLLNALRSTEERWRECLLSAKGLSAQELLQQVHSDLVRFCTPLAERAPGAAALSPWEICVESVLSQWLAKPLQPYTAPLMAALAGTENDEGDIRSGQRLSEQIARSGRAVASLRSTGEKIGLAWANTMRATAISFDSIHQTNASAELLRITVRRPADAQLRTVRVVRSPVICQQLQPGGGGQVKRALGAFFANVVGAGSAAPDTMKVVPEVQQLLGAGRKIQYLTLLDGQAKGEVVEPGSIRALRGLHEQSQQARSPLFWLLEVNLNRWVKGARQGTNGYERLAQKMRAALAPWIEPGADGRVRCPGLQQRLPAMEQIAQGVMMAQELHTDAHLKTYLLTLAALVRIQLILEEVPDFDIAACKDGMDRAGALNMVSSALLVWLSSEDLQSAQPVLETVVAQCLAACFLAKGLPINDSWGGAARHALDTLQNLIGDRALWNEARPGATTGFLDELKQLFSDPENRFGEILKVSLPNEAITIDPASPSVAWYRGALRSPEQADRLYARMMDAAPFRADRRVLVADQDLFESEEPTVVAQAVYPLIQQQVRPELMPTAATHIRDGRRAHDRFETQCTAEPVQEQQRSSTRRGRWAMAIRSESLSDVRTWYVGGEWHLSAPDITGERALDFSIGPRTWLLMQD